MKNTTEISLLLKIYQKNKTKLFRRFEAFSLEIEKNSILGLIIDCLRKKLRITMKVIFFKEFETMQILGKVLLWDKYY